MCTISNKIKLCTCATNPAYLKHFWVLYRFVKGKDEMIMGQPVLPADIDPATNAVNQNLLLSLLNEGNAFDKPLYPVNKDRLQISFTTPDGGLLSYGFIYKKGIWQAFEFDYFNWFTEHDEIKEGKIKNAFALRRSS